MIDTNVLMRATNCSVWDITILLDKLLRDGGHAVEVARDPHLADLDPLAHDLVLLVLVGLPDEDAVPVLVVLHVRPVHALPARQVDGVAHLGRAQELLTETNAYMFASEDVNTNYA